MSDLMKNTFGRQKDIVVTCLLSFNGSLSTSMLIPKKRETHAVYFFLRLEGAIVPITHIILDSTMVDGNWNGVCGDIETHDVDGSNGEMAANDHSCVVTIAIYIIEDKNRDEAVRCY